MISTEPVSIVIPMYSAEKYIAQVLDAIIQQDYSGEREVIVVNDGSRDRSLAIVQEFSRQRAGVTVIDQPNQGAVAATNNGFSVARYGIVCSIDSDVVLHSDWLSKIMAEFSDSRVAAVQGYYKTPEGVSFWARMMGYDVEKRYDDIKQKYVSQVCTGNTAYRKSSLEQVGFFDPAFIYGYDNDMSYRLQKAGYLLVFRKDALCDHYWKDDVKGYISQQYKSAYGRMQLVQRHRDRAGGDSVSGLRMILQVPLTILIIGLTGSGVILGMFGWPGTILLISAALLLAGIMVDRLAFAYGIMRKQRDARALLLPFVHLLRNGVWCVALVRWILRKLWTRWRA